MPSRFTGLAEDPIVKPEQVPWDVYDDCPLDPNYTPRVSLQACTPTH